MKPRKNGNKTVLHPCDNYCSSPSTHLNPLPSIGSISVECVDFLCPNQCKRSAIGDVLEVRPELVDHHLEVHDGMGVKRSTLGEGWDKEQLWQAMGKDTCTIYCMHVVYFDFE